MATYTSDYTDGAVKYYWDFENDGVIDSTKPDPVHIYGQSGEYSINLTIERESGNVSLTKPNYITVSNPAFSDDPIAWMNWIFRYLSSIFVGLPVVSE